MSALTQQLGPLFYPLMACSLIASLILLERLFVLISFTLSGRLIKAGLIVLEHHQDDDKATREEVLSIWLQRQQKVLASGLRLLHIVAMIAPLLGLLGTVLGLIQVFDSLALHTGPIEPSLLADGLGLAMKTTAMGLIIAIPAMLGAYLYQLWTDKLIHSCEHELNLRALRCSGVCTEALA